MYEPYKLLHPNGLVLSWHPLALLSNNWMVHYPQFKHMLFIPIVLV